MYQPSEVFMNAALEEARKAKQAGDYAIGAVIVWNNEIIARAGNRVRQDQDPTQHAEVVAIRIAAQLLKNRHLTGCILYTTHEPCPMCAGAAVFSKLEGVVSGSTIKDMSDFAKLMGNVNFSWRTIKVSAKLVLANGEPPVWIAEGFMRHECVHLFHV